MADFRPLQPTRDTDQREEQKLAKKIKNFIYDPSDVIGSGFSSKVYKGINQQNNEQVAIKVIELSKIQNQVQKYLLNNQINALRALNHKNILKTIDILMTKNNVYIVTQFCEFGDLQQMIKNNKKLQQKDALNIARDVVQGYMEIEQKNVIHRDLKTANIFLTKTGAKIADFGFCEFMGEKKPQIAYNVGSPAYMSPESYKQNFYSNKSDIWGIGIILYEMLIGETPEKNLTYTEMSTNLMNGKINCGPNEDIRQILISCFRRDLKERTDTRTLLQNINRAIQKLAFNEQRNQIVQVNPLNSNVDSRFKNPPMTPTDAFSRKKDDSDNLRFSTDDKKFISVSPSKLNNQIGRSQFEDSKPFSIIQPMNLQNNSRKKEGLNNSNLFNNFNSNKTQPVQQSKRIRSSISMLQFTFRLFKYISDSHIPIFSFIKLILFRQRSYIDQSIETLTQQSYNDPSVAELIKEFQFLKKMFDSAYLERDHSNIQEGNHEIMNTMNKLANLTFIDTQCINAYKEIIRKGCDEIQSQINENRSSSFALWDYLMLEYEILTLYGQGLTDMVIANEKIPLQAILKQQPKSISKIHIQLLKIKSKFLFERDFVESHNQGSNISPPGFLMKHASY